MEKETKKLDSVIGWVGGKRALREKIISYFPDDFKMYVEVFGGAGWVLFGREKHAKDEVYNDFNSDLVNLFRCIKYHDEAFKKELDYTLQARAEFTYYTYLKKLDGLTDIQRASLFFKLIKFSFGSKGEHFATRGRSLKNTVLRFSDIANRLDKVVIENKDFESLIKLYDRKTTLFYLDPPYYGTEDHYNRNKVYFTSEDHLRLRNILDDIKGRFILSYNDCEYIRKLYKDYIIIEVSRKENLSKNGKNQNDYKELIIKNY